MLNRPFSDETKQIVQNMQLFLDNCKNMHEWKKDKERENHMLKMNLA